MFRTFLFNKILACICNGILTPKLKYEEPDFSKSGFLCPALYADDESVGRAGTPGKYHFCFDVVFLTESHIGAEESALSTLNSSVNTENFIEIKKNLFSTCLSQSEGYNYTDKSIEFDSFRDLPVKKEFTAGFYLIDIKKFKKMCGFCYA